VHFKSDRQRRAIFASLGNKFSFSSSGVSTGSGIADAIVGACPDDVNECPPGGFASNAIVNLWPNEGEGNFNRGDVGKGIVGLWPDGKESTSSRSVGDGIVGLWPGGKKDVGDLYTLYYPIDTFSEQEVFSAREEFDYPMAWVMTKEGNNYKMVLDPILVKKYYGGV